MKREHKFRFWDSWNECYTYSDKIGSLSKFFELYEETQKGENNPVLQEFSGLHDKNKAEIYEGDIVKCNNGHIGDVVWEEEDCCFEVTDYYSQCDDYPTMAFMEGQPFIVIGNIYQNPELLK